MTIIDNSRITRIGKLLLCVTLLALGGMRPAHSTGESTTVPIVVELFTSEGCSSCPPADALLPKLQSMCGKDAEIIPLSEHVDYWNHLGWHDPFSSKIFTLRQHRYAKVFKQSSVYTPELVIDGVKSLVGSNDIEAARVISLRRKQAKQHLVVELKIDKGNRSAHVEVRNSARNDQTNSELAVFLTEDNITMSIKAGENNGRTLRHHAVARALKIAKPDPLVQIDFPLKDGWRADSLRAVAILQNKDSLEITAAGSDNALSSL